MNPSFTFSAEIWLWSGKAAWHFIRVPLEISQEIKGFQEGPRRGFGSMPVKATIKTSSWKTSIFPEKEGSYLLPLKTSIRKEAKISKGDTVEVTLELQ